MTAIRDIMLVLALLVVVFIGGHVLGTRQAVKHQPPPTRDTVVVRDTLRDTVRLVSVRYRVRTDTIYVAVPTATPDAPDSVAVPIPIEQREYKTENYRAVVEGYCPRLVDVEIYRATKYITNTNTVTTRKRWGASVGVQCGYGATPVGMQPYAGIGVNFGYSF